MLKKLVEIAIEREYFDKATELIELIPRESSMGYLPNLLKGDVAYAKGAKAIAIQLWESVKTDDAKGQYEVGERFRRAQEYEKAISCFQNSYAAEQTPKHLDALYSLAFLYKKIGRYEEAIRAWQTIIDVFASDYGVTGGESIEWALREIQQLKRQ